jgi:Leucine-rich repeat (LRR) protein
LSAAYNCTSVTEIPQTECEALVALYNSANGTGWITNMNWLVTNTPCSWYGVGCGGGYVASINLDANQLTGSIPTELDNLTLLSSLSLSQNQLSGSIPVELGNLVYLQNLSLWQNQLTGNIPTELGNLTLLEYLPLCENQLTGNIPTELGNLTQLVDLCLSTNQLSGSIPTELGNLTQLTSLRLSNNQLSGSIPAELGNLTQLQQLHLSNNLLSNSIPVELGNLTQLTGLELNLNQLSGSIPTQLGNLIQLQKLLLGINQLSGSIPAELGNLTQLKYLYLYDNQLSGSIPAELGNLTQLTSLDLWNNQLTGSIPVELGNLTQLTGFYLQYNQLSGSIPTELGNLTQLTELYLQHNQLTGNIPAELGNLTQLQNLYLSTNQLTGSIPTELGNLTQLTILQLHNNQLSGEFPVSITNLVNLTTLTFDCGLTSTDPTVIAFIENLVPDWQNACHTISGTVRDESGTPITGTTITVTAESPDGQVAYNSADSNPADGTYTINNLPLDTNMMITVYGNDVYGAEYYEEAVFRSLATVFNLTEATPTVSNVDFTLPPSRSIPYFEQLAFNVRAGRILNDLVIRKAIAYGTDRERILNKALLGNSDMYGVVLNSLVAPGYWSQPAYNQVNIYPYNPAQANAILDAAGIIDNDNNGIRETVGGGDIVLDFKTTDAAFRAASSAIFVENMVAIGIQVNVTLVPSDVFFSTDPAISPLVAGDFDIAEFAWGSYDQNLDDLYVWQVYQTGNYQNYGGYANATVDAEFSAAMAATDRASMLPHVLAYYAEITDDMPSLSLFTRGAVTPVSTISGTNVLADLSSVGVRVTFQNATSDGRTAAYASAIHPNDLPLNNTRVAVYEIGSSVTMATGTGATVCVNYDDSGLTIAEENKLQLHHLTMTDTRKWTNISTSRNTTTNQVCGFANSFSTFAVLLPVSMSRTFYSTASQDGWILESSETSNAGGTMSASSATLSLGDNNQKKQYRSILSFATASLPDPAVITKVTLKLKHSSVTPARTNPITLLQGIYVDLRKGFFGTSANLQLTDFNATASKTVGPFKPALTAGWYTISLNSATFASINKLATNGGLTQIRLRFKLDDNNNTIANMLNLVSGNNANPVNRPTLLIEYYVP